MFTMGCRSESMEMLVTVDWQVCVSSGVLDIREAYLWCPPSLCREVARIRWEWDYGGTPNWD